jgi:hypothetical protein
MIDLPVEFQELVLKQLAEIIIWLYVRGVPASYLWFVYTARKWEGESWVWAILCSIENAIYWPVWAFLGIIYYVFYYIDKARGEVL